MSAFLVWSAFARITVPGATGFLGIATAPPGAAAGVGTTAGGAEGALGTVVGEPAGSRGCASAALAPTTEVARTLAMVKRPSRRTDQPLAPIRFLF
ncbi:MAG: hypothetical protein KF850_06180 [Labilithrix sp.]|nr:hypothetical protein [Labilithrix sp.]